jgi:hypothetical protein
MRCPQPLDRRPAADLAGRPSRTAADGPGEEPTSSAPLRNSSPSGRYGPASAPSSPRSRSAPGEAKRIVEVRDVARIGKELEPAGRYQPMGRARVLDRDDRVAPSAPAFGSSGSAAGLPEPPFLRLPFGRDIDRQARIDQRGARIAPPSAAQEAKRAPPPRLESSLRLPLAARRTAGKPAAGQLGPVPPRAVLVAASSRSLLKRDDPRAGLAAASRRKGEHGSRPRRRLVWTISESSRHQSTHACIPWRCTRMARDPRQPEVARSRSG